MFCNLIFTGFPGSCCDLYDCEPFQPPNNTCHVNNTIYPEGSSWSTPEGICKCHNGIELCFERTAPENNEQLHEHRSCLVSNQLYQHNETWAQDSCTNCTCVDGDPVCIAHFCELNQGHLEKADCLPLANCNKDCPNGFKMNKRGCEICKCAKGGTVEDIMRSYNVTEADLVMILEERLKVQESRSTSTSSSTTTTTTTTTSSTTAAPATTVQILDTCGTKGKSFNIANCSYTCV